MRHRRPLPLFLVLLVVGCSAKDAGNDQAPRASANRIVAEELVVHGSTNLLETVTILRPTWLRDRGRVSLTNETAHELVVYLDGTRLGGAEYLRRIRASDVSLVHYLNPSQATNRFGTGHSGGAIVVFTLNG